MSSTTSTTNDRALSLLGQGVPPGAVANALGVDPSRITQLLADTEFATKVIELKFEALSKHNERDQSIDGLEDRLLARLKDVLPYMTRPMEILKAFSLVNAAKRRGQIGQQTVTNQQAVVQLNIPQLILNHFQTNIHNQVIQVGSKSLLTIPSGQLLKEIQNGNQNVAAPIRNTEETVRNE